MTTTLRVTALVVAALAFTACGNDLSSETTTTKAGGSTETTESTDTTESTETTESSDTTETTEEDDTSTTDDSGSDGDTKAGYTRDEFIEEFKTGFGSSDANLPDDRVECIGGTLYDDVTEEQLKSFGTGGVSGNPEAAKLLVPAFSSCLEFADILGAAGDSTAGLDVECISEQVDFSEADEEEFWTAALEGGEPPADFQTRVQSAVLACS